MQNITFDSQNRTNMKNNDWKERLNVVYSTNPDYNYERKIAKNKSL